MGRLLSSGLIGVALVISSIAASAMPLAVHSDHTALVGPVADGCGFNKYRDARGICRQKYVIGARSKKMPLYGACGGVNSHRVCNLYGQCWTVCD